MSDISKIQPEDIPAEPKILSKLPIDGNTWFEAREDGLWFFEKKEKDGKKFDLPHRLTHSRLEIVGFLEPIDGDIDRGLLVCVPKEVTVRREDVAKAADLEGWLANHGVRFDPTQTAKIRRYFQIWYGDPITAYTRNGWQRDDAFVVGDQIIHGEGRVLKTEANLTKFEVRGTYEEWRDAILPLAAHKPGWLFGILVGLSSPLLAPLNLNTGYGFNLHCRSSTGKTIALQAAAGVWGRPDSRGCLKSFDTTINAIEGLAEGHSHLGLVMDEMKKGDPKFIRDSIYKLANGQGKERMNSNSTMQRHRFWKVNTFVSSEKTIEGMFDAVGEKQAAGQVIRFIDVDGALLLPDLALEQVREFEDVLMTCYGTAGPEFVRRIMNLDDLAERHSAAIQSLYGGEDARIQRAAAGFALLSVAGEIMGIDTAVVGEAFDRWLGEGIADVVDDHFQIAKQVLEFIDRRLNVSIIEIAEEDDEWNTSGEAGSSYRERDGWHDGNYVYLLAPVVDDLLGGHGKNAFYTWLKARKLIKARAKEGEGVAVYVPRIKPRKTAVAFHLESLRAVVDADPE